MAVLAYDEYKQKLNAFKDTFENLQKALQIDAAKAEIRQLEAETNEEGFWNDIERSQKNQRRCKQLKNKVERHQRLLTQWEDLMTLVEMGIEEDDASLLPELEEGYASLEKKLEEERLSTLLSGEYDSCNAILTFHAGAGGTEAQDWAAMLYRMYMQWSAKHGFEFEMLDYLDGDEAGLKSATVMIRGENAYGYLREKTVCTGWCVFLLLTPMPGGRPPSPLWRSCRNCRMILKWRSVRRTSRCRFTVPPAPAASTSTRPPPPCV